MNVYEQLAVLTAIDKAVKARIRDVRREADCVLMDAYEDMGVERMALRLNGEKVGDFVVTFAKKGFDITDMPAFEEFALDYGLATQREYVRPSAMRRAVEVLRDALPPDEFAEVVGVETLISSDWEKGMTDVCGVACYMDSGLPVPGVDVRRKAVKSTMVRGCSPEQVIPIAGQIDGGVAPLLTGGAA